MYLGGRSQVIASQGFARNDFKLLSCFLEQDEWTATQLTGAIAADASRVSRLVNGLVQRGLLRRRRRVDDRRVVRLMLTDEGISVARGLAERVREYDDHMLAGVTDDEREALIELTSKVLANHAALQDGPSD
ncbi:MAG: MarR family transcriptional regulator [Chloroflexi bacterium]|nr:MarR family transcriptional regulator [Chloroflexota bacterium]